MSDAALRRLVDEYSEIAQRAADAADAALARAEALQAENARLRAALEALEADAPCCDSPHIEELHQEPYGQPAAVYNREADGKVRPTMYETHQLR